MQFYIFNHILGVQQRSNIPSETVYVTFLKPWSIICRYTLCHLGHSGHQCKRPGSSSSRTKIFLQIPSRGSEDPKLHRQRLRKWVCLCVSLSCLSDCVLRSCSLFPSQLETTAHTIYIHCFGLFSLQAWMLAYDVIYWDKVTVSAEGSSGKRGETGYL